MRPKSTWLAVSWTLVVFGICWTPRTMMPVAEELPRPFLLANLDKVVHFGIFAIFGLAWVVAVPGRAGRVLTAGIAAAALSELGQITPLVNRDAEWADGIADVLGVAAGMIAYLVARAAFRRRAEVPPAPTTIPSAGTP